MIRGNQESWKNPVNECDHPITTIDTAGGRWYKNSDPMIRLPILKDELAFLEKLLPDLETRPDLGHLAVGVKERIDKIRQEIRALEENKRN